MFARFKSKSQAAAVVDEGALESAADSGDARLVARRFGQKREMDDPVLSSRRQHLHRMDVNGQ